MVSLSHGVVSPYLRVGGEGEGALHLWVGSGKVQGRFREGTGKGVGGEAEGALHRIEPLVLLERHLPFLEGAVLAYAGGQAVVGGWGVSQG
jgi:hypothetical protein